uniref:Zinc transporter ZIP1 n=1 Tax=Panagrolaimus davidi TaxID=227884 RepID=A0A914QVF4_9BILA
MTVAVLPPPIDECIHHTSDLSVISCEDPQKLSSDYSSTASDQPFGFRTETICIKDSEAEAKHEKRKALVSALTFVLALGIHTFLEGFAFGVQDTQSSVTSLFFGIIVHKALVMFSVGMSLTEKLSDRKWAVIILVTALSLFSPLSATIGLLIQDSNIQQTPKAIISTVLTCFSIGCFFFISFFDILAVERKNKHSNILQWIACVCGYIATALMIIVAK